MAAASDTHLLNVMLVEAQYPDLGFLDIVSLTRNSLSLLLDERIGLEQKVVPRYEQRCRDMSIVHPHSFLSLGAGGTSVSKETPTAPKPQGHSTYLEQVF
jgi:hypothetical protein